MWASDMIWLKPNTLFAKVYFKHNGQGWGTVWDLIYGQTIREPYSSLPLLGYGVGVGVTCFLLSTAIGLRLDHRVIALSRIIALCNEGLTEGNAESDMKCIS